MFNLDDPKVQALLMAAGGLLTPTRARGGAALAEGVSRGIQGGLLGYNKARQMQDQRGHSDLQRKMQEMQLAGMERDQKFNQVAFRPGIGAPPATPNDDNGYPMPSNEPRFDFAAAAAVDPMRAYQLRQSMNKAEAPIKVSKDEVLLDPVTRQPIYTNRAPEKPDLPSGMRMGANGPEWIPGYISGRKEISRAGAPSVSVNTGTQENAFSKEYGKSLAESYSNLMKGDLAASSTLNNLSRLESLLKSAGQTGPIAPTLVGIKAVAKQLGITDPNIADATDYAKASAALSNQLALELRNPSGGAGMPGALSDKDREFLVGMTAGIHQLPNANAMVIETRRRVARREKEVAKLARDYRKRTGRFDEGFYEELARYSEANPLFGDLISQTGAANDTQALVDEARRRGLVK